jgi:hypothetical protein
LEDVCDDALLDKIPLEAALLLDDALLVESSNNPLRADALCFGGEETAGAGGCVSLLRFLPNFFFVVVSACCVDLVMELIVCCYL